MASIYKLEDFRGHLIKQRKVNGKARVPFLNFRLLSLSSSKKDLALVVKVHIAGHSVELK